MVYGGVVVFLATLFYFFQVSLSCQPPDCDHPDCGTCGTACCKIEFSFDLAYDDVNAAMVKSFKAGGADKRYTYVNEEDYRKSNNSVGLKWQMQAIHTTLVHHYNDTLNFLVQEGKSEKETIVEAFSISQVYDAWCDDGQNYKNLVGYVKGLGVDFKQKVVFGCTRSS